uniref:serine O-acetyltransferase n=1 Tax=Octactis speculum TaxID=3111310 RepID=A0A7S2BJI2_9STRA
MLAGVLNVDLLTWAGASILIAALFFLYSHGKRWNKENELRGPVPAKHDQMWKNIRRSCIGMSSREPLLRIWLEKAVVSQPSFESAICMILAEKLATPSIPAAEWSSFLSGVLVRPGKPPEDLALPRTAMKNERIMVPSRSMLWGEGESSNQMARKHARQNSEDQIEAQIGGTHKNLLINSDRPSYATFSRAECASLCKAFQDTMNKGPSAKGTPTKLQPYGRSIPMQKRRSSSTIVQDLINGEWDPATDKNSGASLSSTGSTHDGDWQLDFTQRNDSPIDFCRGSIDNHVIKDDLLRCKASVAEDGAWRWPPKEGKWPLTALLRADLRAVIERDPASDGDPGHPFLFFKGYHGLTAHRIAHVLWHRGSKAAAHLIQSRCSEVFGMDIHPAATIGRGCMFDHATGIVVGESTVIGDDCSFLHGVTLGGTGKQTGDRHPKLGDGVLVGANASILGNIRVGSCTKIGCGSVVLRAIPNGATAVGIPAKVIGRSSEENPGDSNDHSLRNVQFLDHSTEEFDFCSIWQRLDTRKEGFLTPQEFHERATTIGKLSPERADEIFFELDKDNDGIVSEKEFFRSIHNIASLAGWDSVMDLANCAKS